MPTTLSDPYREARSSNVNSDGAVAPDVRAKQVDCVEIAVHAVFQSARCGVEVSRSHQFIHSLLNWRDLLLQSFDLSRKVTFEAERGSYSSQLKFAFAGLAESHI